MNCWVIKMKKSRVFHGLSEVAGQAYYSVKGLREYGITTNYVVWHPNVLGYEYDYSLDINWNKKYMLPLWLVKIVFAEVKALIQCEIFHFHYGRSFLFNYDLWLFKILNKKLYFEFHGSDLRDYRYAHELNRYMEYGETSKGADKLKKRTNKICKYAEGIILHDDELIAHLPSKTENIYVVPLRVDIEKIQPVYSTSLHKTIRIVHAPTNQKVKGSKFVIEAIKQLEKKYPVELILVENKTQEEAFEIYKTADIIVDQLRIGTYGVFAIEGMALGKPIVTYITEQMKEKLPSDLPICSANPDTIYSVLETLVTDKGKREELGIKGRQYVEKYHDYRKNTRMLYDIYSGKLSPIQGREAFRYVAELRE